jgi:hypothetical protein
MPPAPITPMLTLLLIFRSVVEYGFNRRLPVGVYLAHRKIAGEVDC